MRIIYLLIIFVTIISCSYTPQLEHDSELSNKLEKEFLSKQNPIKLADVTDFEWDNFLLVQPYTNIEVLQKKMNLNLENIKHHRIENVDWITLLVLIKDKRSIRICELKRELVFDPTLQLTIIH